MPAWIHPIRLTTVQDALERLTACCHHLRRCLDCAASTEEVLIDKHPGLEVGTRNRMEIVNCLNHAELLATALTWANSDPRTAGAIVSECHAAQSSGGADL